MGLYFGVDIGGTTVKLGRFTEDGILREKWAIPTRVGENGKYIFDDIAASILNKTVEAGGAPSEIQGVGIGIPGPILPDGCMERGVNVGMRHVYPAREVGERLRLSRVCCGNDADAAALGEAWKGGGAGFSSIFLFTLGTGVGGGAVADGRILGDATGWPGKSAM